MRLLLALLASALLALPLASAAPETLPRVATPGIEETTVSTPAVPASEVTTPASPTVTTPRACQDTPGLWDNRDDTCVPALEWTPARERTWYRHPGVPAQEQRFFPGGWDGVVLVEEGTPVPYLRGDATTCVDEAGPHRCDFAVGLPWGELPISVFPGYA